MEVIRIVKKIKKVKVKVLRGDEWQIEGNLVLKERTVYMLKNEELRVEIFWLHHNILAVEYGGR